MRIRNLLLAVAVVASAAAAQPHRASETLDRAVTGGRIRGFVENGSEAFLGIPYAAAPVGVLRWRDPQPVPAWTGLRDAAKAPPACYQGPPGTFGPITREFVISPERSEDCLYLNVWRPRGAAAKKLPVFFWIHGGGFGSGSASIPVYDGSEKGEKIYNTLTVIGHVIAPNERVPTDAAAGKEALAGLKRWPVTVSYFDQASKSGEQAPVYAIKFELYENGISRALVLDYNDFAISGELTSLEVRDTKPCK